MSHLETIIDPTTVQGNGRNLYALIMIDQDDAEDTSFRLWRADDEDHFYDQVNKKFGEDNFGEDLETEIWGILWLPKYIGQIKE